MSRSDRAPQAGARSSCTPSLTEVVAGLPVALAIVHSSGTVWLTNAAAERTLRRDEGSLAGSNIGGVLAPLEKLLMGAPGRDRSVSIAGPHGEPCEVGYTIAPITDARAGQLMYAIVFRDITRSALLASERSRLLRLASIGAAAPTVIHEVKSSLAALAMGLELLAERADDPESRSQSSALAAEAANVARTLDGFGAVGRELRAAVAVDLAPMLDDARCILSAKAERHGIALAWDTGDFGPVALTPEVVHALIFQLVTNALQACEVGDCVVVGIDVEADEFTLRVEDTGRGMSAEEVERCTEIFFTTSDRGSGVGLALCNEAVQAAAGRLTVESQLGQGTAATIVVPLMPRKSR